MQETNVKIVFIVFFISFEKLCLAMCYKKKTILDRYKTNESINILNYN